MSGCIVISCWENYIVSLLYTTLKSFKHQSNLGTFSSLKKKKTLKEFPKAWSSTRICSRSSVHAFSSAYSIQHHRGEGSVLAITGWENRLPICHRSRLLLHHSAERRKLKITALIAVIKFEVNKTIKIQDRKKLIGKWRFLKLEADSSCGASVVPPAQTDSS